jgi:hypothetical protein
MARATRKAHGPSAGGPLPSREGLSAPRFALRSRRRKLLCAIAPPSCGNQFPQFPQAMGMLSSGVDSKSETGKMRSVSRAKFLQGVSAGFRQFPPRRLAQTGCRSARRDALISLMNPTRRMGAGGFRPLRPFRPRLIFHPRGALPLNRRHNACSRRRTSATARPQRTAPAKSGWVAIQF